MDNINYNDEYKIKFFYLRFSNNVSINDFSELITTIYSINNRPNWNIIF